MKNIYKHYKERLIEISGRNRSLFSKKISKSYSYDIGAVLEGDYEEIERFLDFLWYGKTHSYTLINKKYRSKIYENLKKDEMKKVLLAQISSLKTLKRGIEEFAKETGRYEMFVGYPFVEGALGNEMVIKAPLLLFPMIINTDGEEVSLEMKTDEPIQFNKVFLLAYAKHYKLNIDELNLEFENLLDYKLKNINAVISYLRSNGIRIGHTPRKGMFKFNHSKEPKLGDSLEIKYNTVIGRFPLANSIYNDYKILEKKGLTTEAIDALLANKSIKKIKKPLINTYTVHDLDYAQEKTVEDINKYGNIVIYGPPGTGKSQTIVNIITDALCKNKRVFVVSQKKAALDVVFNRLGILNNKVMYINDAEKGKAAFYERVKNAHTAVLGSSTVSQHNKKYEDIDAALKNEIKILETISNTLFTKTSFGLTLQQMYANSYLLGKNTNEYKIYEELIKSENIMKLGFNEINEAVRIIKEKRKAELYYKHMELQKNNPLTDHIKEGLDVHTINDARGALLRARAKRIAPFDMSKYPNARQLITFYIENGIENPKELKSIIKFIANIENPKLRQTLAVSCIIFPMYPFFKAKMIKKQNEIAQTFNTALTDIKEYVKEYEILQKVIDKRGYAMIIDNLLNGNTLFLNLLQEILDNYVNMRDMFINLKDINSVEFMLLGFAYKNSKTLKQFKEVLDKILSIRIYRELVVSEEVHKEKLSKIMSFENIKNRIVSLKNEQETVVHSICLDKFKQEYAELYKSNPDNKNFLYQISKPQNLWPIRKLTEMYEDLLLKLFPCWLLSPESVSTIMPLKKEMVDLILFDEASQIFIENTLPTIYRGKYIAIAGDNKQLRPTAAFVKRYMGSDIDELDMNTQAALEVESLLDLATSRYNASNLTYHYRSQNEELINFSNYAFYDCKLQIAPNVTKNKSQRPIEVVKVDDGKWAGGHNHEEANKVVEIVKRVMKNRRNKETVGIITFNAEQQQYIEDLFDRECDRNPVFKNAYLKELNRKVNGEDVGLFIKNLENVQGDERDIIIFSIGYAKNEYGKVAAYFGPLNLEGGENRLNVAITRAKKKIYVVTSIEAEELKVESSKNIGPKLFKKYLQYARAVSSGSNKEVSYILHSLKQQNELNKDEETNGFEHKIKDGLEKLGYTVETNLGNNAYKLSLAVYDKELDRYLVGIECDYAAFNSSGSIVERDVFRSKFMQSRGWKILRVWSRDWWLDPHKVIINIAKIAEKSREEIKTLNEKQK